MFHYLPFIFSLLFTQPLLANNSDQPPLNIKTTIERQLRSLDPNIPVESIKKSPVSGLSIVTLTGGQMFYISHDGQHILEGNMLKIDNGNLVNLTRLIREQHTAKQLGEIKKDDMIIFPAEEKTTGIVYAFTDVDCGFCRKLHQEIPALNAKGIELRYLAFPRGGKEAPAYNKMVSAWCATDRKGALAELKTGRHIPEKNCNHPVDNQFALGVELGVTGTPTLFLENGKSLPGYRPAQAIAELMGI